MNYHIVMKDGIIHSMFGRELVFDSQEAAVRWLTFCTSDTLFDTLGWHVEQTTKPSNM